VVFDFDGVIVDSEPAHFRALAECLEPEGITINEREYERQYLAYDDREAIRIALETHEVTHDRETIEHIAVRKAQIFEKLILEIGLLPGVRALVESLQREVPIAIASGALRTEIEQILDATELRGAISLIVAADDVSRTKPDPEPFLRAITALAAQTPDLRPEECLAFEDSIAGIASARAAGMKVIGITNSYPAGRLGAAHHVLDTLVGLDCAGARRLFEEN
jgi:beta-phosphoglucomutase